MTPNLITAGSVLGLLGFLNIPLDIMTITVAAISVGMAVDNTIHYIYRYKKPVVYIQFVFEVMSRIERILN